MRLFLSIAFVCVLLRQHPAKERHCRGCYSRPNRPFDSTLVQTFFTDHPKAKNQPDVEQLYRKHKFHYVWYDHNGV
jgi:hypothetical protein